MNTTFRLRSLSTATGATAAGAVLTMALASPAAATGHHDSGIWISPKSGGAGTKVHIKVKCDRPSDRQQPDVSSAAFVSTKKLRRVSHRKWVATATIKRGLVKGKRYDVTAVCNPRETHRTQFKFTGRHGRPDGPAGAGMGGLAAAGSPNSAAAFAAGGGFAAAAAAGYVVMLRRRSATDRV